MNYQTVYKLIQREMAVKSKLLENIAKRILDALYDDLSGIQKVSVTIRKMNPPMGGKMRSVNVTLCR